MLLNNLRNKIYAIDNNKIIRNFICNNIILNIKQYHIDNIQKEHNNINVFDNTKLIKVAIIGVPNAGKSTLINNLMDRKVCPTSNKVHTTRKKSHAILTEFLTQIVFLDTPGIVSDAESRRYHLDKSFTKDCVSSLNEADIIGVIHDVSNTWTQHRIDIKIIKLLQKFDMKNSFLVLNKIDALKSKRKLLNLTNILTQGCINNIPFDVRTKNKLENSEMKGWSNFSEVFMISALYSDGITQLKDYLLSQAKPGKYLYPENVWSNHSPDDIVLRTVQATLLDFLPQEIPYKLKTTIEFFEIGKNDKINVVVLVKCPAERIRKLVAGVGDGKLRQITEKAQRDLLNTFDQYVRLQIVLNCDK